MATIFDIAEDYRAALARREQQALGRLIRQYGDIWKALKAELDRLQADHAARIARGEVPSPAWVYQEQRARALLAQVEAEVTRWSGDVEEATRELQRIGAMQGQQYVVDTLRASGIAPGIEGSFMRLSPDTLHNMVGFLGDGSPLARLFDQVGPGVRAGWTSALMTGLAAGLNPREVARLARQATGMGMDRALRIARTEMLRASRETVHQTMLANPDIYDGWIWSCSLSLRTCASCLAMNGTWHPLSERLEDHPNGRCAAVPSLKPWSSLGVNVPEPVADPADSIRGVPDAEAWLRELPAAAQEHILGKQAAELWRRGEIALHEFTERKVSPDWGGMRVQKPLGRILADKQARWAGLARGDAGGLSEIMAHYGIDVQWSGKIRIEAALYGTRIGALFDGWPGKLPNGKMTRGVRAILISPEAASDISVKSSHGILQVLHELTHAASPGLTKATYARHKKIEELTCELVSLRLLKSAMADIGAQYVPQQRRIADAFVRHLERRGLSREQIDQMIDIGLRVQLEERRTAWVDSIADMLGLDLSEARRILRDSLPRTHEF